MVDAEVIIVATSAPHYVITADRLKLISKIREMDLTIIDIGNPRQVEEVEVPRIKIWNIDYLRNLTEENLKKRLNEIEKAEKIIEDEFRRLTLMIKKQNVEPLIKALNMKLESIRLQEFERACSYLEQIDSNDEIKQILDKLSKVIIRKSVHQAIQTIRNAAANDNDEIVAAAMLIFDIKSDNETELNIELKGGRLSGV
jgi:glutamyl-tRNA reductase